MMFTRRLNKELYGPSRRSANAEIKDVLLGDHVLQKGEWYENGQRNPWATSFAISFKNPESKERVNHIKDVKKNVTCFVLGSEKGPSLATTAQDYENKLRRIPEKAAPSLATSIADFAPKYMSDKSFGKSGSVYVNSFSKESQGLQGSSARNRAECQENTNDLHTTHFQLGNHGNEYGSETMLSFHTKSRLSPEKPSNGSLGSFGAAETHQSSVFRSGDWNETESQLEPHSVTRIDFHIEPFSVVANDCKDNSELHAHVENTEGKHNPLDPKDLILVDNPNHPYYQRNTHFVLGNNRDQENSLYYKDFLLGNRECLSKPLPAPAPISSKVLPGNEEYHPPLHSTNRADFVNHKTYIQQIGQGRETKINRERHNATAVVLTCDVTRHARDREASITGADYLHPPRDLNALSPQKAPRSKYRYLDSDGALLKAPAWPMPSETKEEFFTAVGLLARDDMSMKHKTKTADCQGRIHDNRRSHFQFGSDVESKHSEKHDKFFSRLHVDPSLPAAGKSEGPEKKYSHVYPRESSELGLNILSNSSPHDDHGAAGVHNGIQEFNEQRSLNVNVQDPMNINLRRAFLEFDTSLSGKISKHDLRNVLSSLGITMDPETFEKLLKMCDPTRSGFIDYREFAKHLTKDVAPLSRGTKPASSSVMKTDYCPPEQRRFTSAQQRTIEMSKKIAPLCVRSHYFHRHSTGAPYLSTTAQDFVRPDRMPGTARISAR